MIFYSHANKTHFHKKGFALNLVLKMRIFGTWNRPIANTCVVTVEPVSSGHPRGMAK